MRVFVRAYGQPLLLALLAAAVAFAWYAVAAEGGDTLRVVMLDVGQGDAFFVRAPSGAQMLIDGGPGDAVMAELGKVMPFYDRSIDVLMLSHPHEDHLSGLVEVLKRYRVGMVIDSGTVSASGAFAEWQRALAASNAAHIAVQRGMRLRLGDDTVFDVLLPTHDVSGASPHEGMLVGLLRYGSADMLFAGDMEQPLEEYLLALGPLPDIDVLKVGHHGSRTSSSAAFLSALSPEHALVSAGEDSRYGHPHAEALGRLKEAGLFIWRTDIARAVVAESDGADVRVAPLRCIARLCW